MEKAMFKRFLMLVLFIGTLALSTGCGTLNEPMKPNVPSRAFPTLAESGIDNKVLYLHRAQSFPGSTLPKNNGAVVTTQGFTLTAEMIAAVIGALAEQGPKVLETLAKARENIGMVMDEVYGYNLSVEDMEKLDAVLKTWSGLSEKSIQNRK
jgi:hypothetical protein